MPCPFFLFYFILYCLNEINKNQIHYYGTAVNQSPTQKKKSLMLLFLLNFLSFFFWFFILSHSSWLPQKNFHWLFLSLINFLLLFCCLLLFCFYFHIELNKTKKKILFSFNLIDFPDGYWTEGWMYCGSLLLGGLC